MILEVMPQAQDLWPNGDSEIAALIRAFDWASTPLGPITRWPQSLKTIVDLMLRSPSMMSLVWGPEAIQLYNDCFTDLLKEHRVHALGQSVFDTFARSRNVFADDLAAGMAGEAARLVGQRYPVLRNGRLEDAWFDVDYVPVHDEAGRVAGVLWTLQETTAQHLAEQALRAGAARDRLLIESWTQAVWETDAAGVVVADSPSWRAYTGQTLEEWLGYGWLDAIHPDDRAYAGRQWREAIADRGLVDAEFRLRAPGGGWRWTNVRAAPVRDAGGAIEKWVGVNIDIDDRKRAEVALRESEERYRSLFNVISQGLAINRLVRDRNGRVIDARYLDLNPAYEVQTGFERAEAIGRLASEIFPLVGPFWLEMAERVVATGQAERIERLNADTGRWFSFDMAPFEGTDQFVVLYDDITARKLAEASLRESEERQAFLLKLSDALRPLADAGDIQATAARLLGTHLGVDRAMYGEVTGEPGAETGVIRGQFIRPAAPGRPAPPPFPDRFTFESFGEKVMARRYSGEGLAVADVFDDADFDASERAAWAGVGVRAAIVAPLVKGHRLVGELGVHCETSRAWTDAEISLVREVGERTWAAAERASAEAASRASEERFRHFADASAAGLWIRAADTLALEFASPAVATIYGVDASAMLGDVTRWAAMIVPDDRPVALGHLEAARAGEAVVHEFRIQRPSDGAFRWIRSTDFPLRDNGRILRVGGIAEDVTEAKLAAEHSTVLLAELQHRVRNIMAMIRSVTRRTGERAASVPDYAELMMGRLLALARVQALLTRAANVSVGIASLVHDEVSVQAQHEGQYHLDGPDIALSPKAAEVLTLAVHELATNALKHGALSTPHGKVTVRWAVAETRGAPWLAFDWTEEGAPERPLPTDDAPRRRGFGSELIEGRIPYELRGRGRLTIEPGGARCHLEFPLKEGASILETGAPQRMTVFGGALDMTGGPDLTGRRVLVVEDDFYLATDAARTLASAGAEIIGPCASEEDAREELDEQRPDAVLVDINLGQGPSFKLAETLKDHGIPFVFTTGYDEDVIPAEFAGVERLEKPFQLRRIVVAVARLTRAG